MRLGRSRGQEAVGAMRLWRKVGGGVWGTEDNESQKTARRRLQGIRGRRFREVGGKRLDTKGRRLAAMWALMSPGTGQLWEENPSTVSKASELQKIKGPGDHRSHPDAWMKEGMLCEHVCLHS